MTDVNYLEEDAIEQPAAGTEVQAPVDEQGTEVESASESSTEERQPEESGWEKRIATLTHKLRRAEEQLKQYTEKPVAPEPLPEIPALPDPDLRLDDPAEYGRQLRAREDAITKRAEMVALQKLEARSRERAAKEAQEAQQQALRQVIDNYANRGKEAGLTVERMAYNETVLQEAGIGGDLGLYLFEDESGPRLVDYLARNESELEKVAKMSPIRAAEYIALNIKPKVAQVKPKVTQAPDPVPRVRGKGGPSDDKPVPYGYSIE